MTIEVQVWQMVAGIVVYTGGIIGVVLWLDSKFSKLLSAELYFAKHERLEERVRQIELKLARLVNGPH